MANRVVVTGMGVMAPNGNNVPDFWDNLVQGKSGIDFIRQFDTSNCKIKIAGEVKNFKPEEHFDRKELRTLDRYAALALVATEEAVKNSGLDFRTVKPERGGVIIGSGIGGIQTLEEQHSILLNKGGNRISPFFIPKMISDIAAGLVAIRYGLTGINYSTTSACASASHAIGNAFHFIRAGIADFMITGGSEAAITEFAISGFSNMKALSGRQEIPEKASSPFDKKRDGFVIAEGAGILVLESLEHAIARGAKPLAEVLGCGFTCDAYHITAPDPEGTGAYLAMKHALDDGNVSPKEIEYINAHGTSTPMNDKTETIAIKRLFGEHAYHLKISSTKSMTGHLLGASGGVEAIALIQTLRTGIIPPTINLEDPDPECDLDYTPNFAVNSNIKVGLSNTFGFGGHNASIVMKTYK